jgi:ribonuclease E
MEDGNGQPDASPEARQPAAAAETARSTPQSADTGTEVHGAPGIAEGGDLQDSAPREKRSRGRDRGPRSDRGERGERRQRDGDQRSDHGDDRAPAVHALQPTLDGFAPPVPPAGPASATGAATALAAAGTSAANRQPETAAGLPKVSAFELPVEELAQVAQASGLNWVNSDAEKIKAAQAAIAAQPEPIHVPREPAPRVVIDEGPLVLIETRRDLRNLTLPFEQQAPN